MTQLGQEPVPVGQAASWHAPGPRGAGTRVRVEAGTLMQKLLPPHLVEPYLSSQRSVLAGFVHRAQDGLLPGPAWTREHGPGPGDVWVLRWRALDIQTYLAAGPAWPGAGPAGPQRGGGYGEPGRPAAELFLTPGPIPVGTEMYRITPAGEEFVARHDGQAWLQPGPRS